MPRFRFLLVMLIVSTLLVIGVVWQTAWPLGIPGEWTWDRLPLAEPWFLAVIPSTIAAIIYMTFIWLAAPRLSQDRSLATGLRLCGLTLAGFAWLCVVQESAPRFNQLSKAGYVLFFRGPSGYFSQARYDVTDLLQFVAKYNKLMAQGEVLHVGTHPPGLIVLFRGLIRLCEDSRSFSQTLVQTQPPSVVAAFNDIAGSASSRETLRLADRAALWLAFLLVQFAAAVTVIPLYGLLRRSHPPRVAWLSASFWPAVPAVAIFLPKSDVLFASLGIFLGWLWLNGFGTDRIEKSARSWVCCAAAGALFWMGLTLSLAMLPIAFLLAVATLWDLFAPALDRAEQGKRIRKLAGGLIVAGITFFCLCLAVWWQFGLNLFETWHWNYLNHAAFYKSYSRTYVKWLVLNPLEFAISAGVPLVVLALAAMPGAVRLPRNPDRSLGWALVTTWCILWLSGKNMGEAARLWTFLTPWLIFPAAATLGATAPEAEPREQVQAQFRLWGIALSCQFVANISLVLRVVGFPLPFPVPSG
jgi:hypothetical protein